MQQPRPYGDQLLSEMDRFEREMRDLDSSKEGPSARHPPRPFTPPAPPPPSSGESSSSSSYPTMHPPPPPFPMVYPPGVPAYPYPYMYPVPIPLPVAVPLPKPPMPKLDEILGHHKYDVKKKKAYVRQAAGEEWVDDHLADWPEDDFRLFCGDLGNDVTDDMLIQAFNKYKSFLKAKVVRNKTTGKSRGYGFISFGDPQEYLKATREMNGKYIGGRPIKLRKSTWQKRNVKMIEIKEHLNKKPAKT